MLLGTGWRIPASTEWTNAGNIVEWDNYYETYASILNIYATGYLGYADGVLYNRGSFGIYWSSSQNDNTTGKFLILESGSCKTFNNPKSVGGTLRCVKD